MEARVFKRIKYSKKYLCKGQMAMTYSVLGIETNQVKEIDPLRPECQETEYGKGVSNERQ